MVGTKKIENYRSLSQIFSNANFRKILRREEYTETLNRILKHTNIDQGVSYKEALDLIYSELLKNYKNEYVYKNTLINKLLLKKYSLSTTVSFNEFNIGDSVSDFVLLNGEARVYEIKTQLDRLDKIEKQIDDYRKFGNKIYIVAHKCHLSKLLELYENSEIGLIELTTRNSLKEIKPATNNLDFDFDILFKTLRKQEYMSLVQSYFNFIPNVPNTQIFRECQRLAKDIPLIKFQKLVIQVLKRRNIKNPKKLIDNNIPESLKHICYNLDLSKKEYLQLEKFLNLKVKKCTFHT